MLRRSLCFAVRLPTSTTILVLVVCGLCTVDILFFPLQSSLKYRGMWFHAGAYALFTRLLPNTAHRLLLLIYDLKTQQMQSTFVMIVAKSSARLEHASVLKLEDFVLCKVLISETCLDLYKAPFLVFIAECSVGIRRNRDEHR